MNESTIQQQIRLGISAPGCKMFRNNCGAYKADDGRLIRYGVASPGGSDLIGWKTRTITPDMVGRRVAVFTAIEVKGPRTRVSDNQQRFVDTVTRAGGIAGIARSLDDAREILTT